MSSAQNYAPTPGTALPISQAVTGTTETLLLAASVAVASSPASLQPAAGTTPLQVAIPANSIIADKPFEVSLSGEVQCEGAENLTLKLYGIAGAPLSVTIGNNVLLGSSGAVAIAAAGTFNFKAIAKLIYGAASGKLTGTVQFVVNNTFVAEAALSNAITGISETGNPILSFGVTATFSVASATANVVNVPINGFSVNY